MNFKTAKQISNACENFKRPENREDSSDFFDFRTNSIVATQAIFLKKMNKRTRERTNERTNERINKQTNETPHEHDRTNRFKQLGGAPLLRTELLIQTAAKFSNGRKNVRIAHMSAIFWKPVWACNPSNKIYNWLIWKSISRWIVGWRSATNSTPIF